MVTNLNLVNAINVLINKPTIAYDLSGGPQQKTPQSITKVCVTALVPIQPFLHSLLVKRGRIKPHYFRIAKNRQQPGNIIIGHLANPEPCCFDDV